jgi:meso-butanediol dehydrogenase/(S,S)-butanediol dehydrogenase/diacetyl reductase
MGDIEGSVALVTGAAQGIGRAIALRLAADGADIALVDLHEDKLDLVASEIATCGRKVAKIIADVSDRDHMREAVARARSDLGSFEIMVNNAEIVQVKPIVDVSPEDLSAIVAVNIAGVVWGIQAAANTFIAHGTKGTIINASSIAGHDGYALLGLYSATKFAVRALTQAAAKELAPMGITVNAYCPGVIDTDMWMTVDQEMSRYNGAVPCTQYTKAIALGRAETPEDVAGFVSYLAGPDAGYMTGQAPLIDGGMVYR